MDEICPEVHVPTPGEMLMQASKSMAKVSRPSDGSQPSSSGGYKQCLTRSPTRYFQMNKEMKAEEDSEEDKPVVTEFHKIIEEWRRHLDDHWERCRERNANERRGKGF